MLISRTSHDLIVATVMASANERLDAKDGIIAELRNQIAKLEESRDWYRDQWRRARGKVVAQPIETERPMPLFEQAAEPPFDSDWTADDHALFYDWKRDLPPGTNAEEEWKRIHGSRSPMLELTV